MLIRQEKKWRKRFFLSNVQVFKDYINVLELKIISANHYILNIKTLILILKLLSICWRFACLL